MSMLQRFEQLNQIPQWQIERICVELENFFRCNAMHGTTLHDDAITFPMVMNRFFGNDSGVSVYIRNVVQEQMNSAFSICYDFFSPNGPLFWYFKRLFESSVPFLLPIIQLPEQLQSILASDTYPAFYKNLIANDIPYCFTLQLNAFQYFMFKFALSGLISHKNMNPPMGRETIDRQTETLYLALAAEYMFTYLPRAQPSDIPPSKGSIKSLVIKSPRPIAKTKYLNLENLPYVTPRLINPAMDSTTNLDVWRAESIASIFLDVWLSYTPSADGMYLPSVELLRCIRVLVKQIHAFSGIGYNIDNCPMEELRRATELQLRERIEPFFMSLFDIWPLDGSLIDLIELWLSYIQPWRYVHNRHLSKSPPPICEHAIVHRFSRFIVANLLSYTQPIVKLVPRLAQFDMTSPISIKILTRLLKVVSSRTMLNFIKRNEIILYRLKQQYDISSLTINISILPEEDNPPIDLEEVDMVWSLGGSKMIDPTNYTPLFSRSVQYQLCQLAKRLCYTISRIKGRIQLLEGKKKKHITLLPYLWQALGGGQSLSPYKTAQDDCYVLESICQWLTEMFAIPSFEMEPNNELEHEPPNNLIFQPSPGFLNRNQHICAQTHLGDPQLLPITNKEIKFLVRALYHVSMKVNLIYHDELSSLWYSQRWWGSIARLMLQPPSSYMERVQLASGLSTMVETSVGPQLSLRSFASYAAVRNVVGAFVAGILLFGSPIYGFIILVLLAFTLTLLR